MKKLLSIILMLALLVSVVSGCGGQSAPAADSKQSSSSSSSPSPAESKPAEKVKITYWHWDANPTSNAIYKELIDRFQKKNPNIEVEYVGLPADSSRQKYMSAVATNSLPDAGGMNDEWIKEFILQNALEPLDSYYDKWQEKDNISKSLTDTLRKVAGDNKIYLLPLFVTIDTVWYNLKMFKEKNIEQPKTIDQFMADAKKYADTKNGKYLFSIRGGAGSAENLFDFIFSYAGEGDFFDKDGNCVINGPKFVQGLDLYTQFYKNQYTPKDDITNGFKEMVAEFGSGTAMMMYHNSSSFPEHLKNLGEGNFMNMVHPTGPDGTRTFKAPNSCGPVVFKSSKNKEAAWKLVSYLASAEATTYLCEKEGRVPVNSGVFKDDWYKSNKYLKTYADATSDSKSKLLIHPSWLADWNNFKKNMQEPDLQAVMLGKKTSKEALDAWAKALGDAQKKYLKEGK